MNQLKLTLLGPFAALQNRQPITAFDSNKVRALLIYLAVERDNHPRELLTSLLWPEQTETNARTNLRQVLYQLRRALGDESADPPWLLISRQSIGFNPAAPIEVDVSQFRALLAAVAGHRHEQLLTCELCRRHLDQAQALYHADFLSGFAIDESEPFELWRRLTQEQLHLQLLDTLHQLALIALQQADLALLLHYADRQLMFDPLREEAHRQRMWALAQSGQRTAALEQYHRCRQQLATQLGIEPDGKTVALYEQIRQHEFIAPTAQLPAPPSAGPPTPAARLPMALTPFIGREREVAEVVALLHQPQPQLLTLVGAGGMGKTRLAMESAQRVLADPAPPAFPDGVCFVALAALQSASGLAQAIATALELPLVGSEPEAILLAYLRPRRLLLILDNFEHLLAGTALVATIHQQAPGVHLLVTARERLNLSSEQLYTVHAMDYAPQSSLAVARHASAVRLFVERAQRVQPAFQVRAENLAAVLQICRLVQGMPLGLELAAAWVELLSLTEIIAEIEKSVDFLAVDWRNVPERQRSMRAVFVWSWELLTGAEQQVFAQLSLFHGGFTRKAALMVAGATLPILAALVRKSLVRRVEGPTATDGRYEIHELLRQFAAEALAAQPGVQPRVEALYSRYYLDFVAARRERLQRSDPRGAAAELQGELDNIRQAWGLALQHHWLTLLEQSVLALREFYVFTGLTREGATIFQAASSALGQALATAPASQVQLLSTFLGFHGSFLIGLGEHAAAQTSAEAAYQLGQTHGVVAGAVLGALVQGQVQRRLGNSPAAVPWLLQTIELAQQQRHQPLYHALLADLERRAVGWLCSIALTQDDYAAAHRYAQAGLAICQSSGFLSGEVVCLTDLFDIARIMGDYTTARQEGERALYLARQIGFRWGESIALWNLGEALLLCGEYGLAAARLEEAVQRFHAIGLPPSECNALVDQGRLQLHLGDVAAATRYLTKANTILQGLDYPAWETYRWRLPQALLAHATGDQQQALAEAERGFQMAQALFGRSQQADALVVLGLVMEASAPASATSAVYQQALTHYTLLGLHYKAAEAQAGLARLALQQGDNAAALAYVETLWSSLSALPHIGYEEPFRVYLSCYQVLAVHADPRAATVLTKGYTLLRHYADQLPDPEVQAMFLNAVPVHRALAAAYAAQQGRRIANVAVPAAL